MLKMIFIGNSLWGDDGAGIYLFHRFQSLQQEGFSLKWRGAEVLLVEAGVGGLNLLNAMDDAEDIWFFDIVMSGGAAGTVYQLPAAKLPSWPSRSTHDFGVEQVVELYYSINSSPIPVNRILLYGIEAQQLEFGAGLSQSVSDACDKVFTHLSCQLNGLKTEV